MIESNLAIEFLKDRKISLRSFEGFCGEFVDEMIHRYPHAKILYIEPVFGESLIYKNKLWSYHMVCVIDGLCHDPWFQDVLPPDLYAQKAFPGAIEMSIFS